ncbi:hypothetical protein Q0601_24280 [Paracoccus onubensis]|uniref:hypothetical protein n=1 Tax=Paracoccus onubensis TaxID=1675788 RepID=UPI00272FC35E|nr:hypothetical protein [Paracoccus onubensis]MDP0930301.1 hypothetical protein [Paracoccus onubensis]
MSFPPSRNSKRGFALVLLFATLNAAPALAYVGPGAGLTAIGTMIAVIAVVILALVGFVWYPLKRLLRKKPTSEEGQESQ